MGNIKSVLRLYKKLDGGAEHLIGAVVQYSQPDGSVYYKFNPRMQSRIPSRKRWTTATAAIPAWAKKLADEVRAV